MSKVIDERVVSMQFDNKHFESNVKTTMSTLDRLKQSLNFSGASTGLENIGKAVNKCDLSPLSGAAESVRLKFSAMEVMAITALTNITNSAVNAGKRIVESLTITPITTGFNEYELKMGSVQTIMASTGESLATVNEYLNELNKYSDQTIYSFQDMTQNIGKFTNAGVKLEDAVLAIKGIANEAAVSGANANEASRAMYNFAQALSTGYVQRIDWKSIELANMATVEFKEQLLNSAIAMGTVEKNAEGMWKAVGDDSWYNTSQMFIETLDEQWLTSEVLIETLKDYADETTKIGKKAKAAATEVKTFTMLLDTLKEAAQSGWAATWEIVVGDFNEAKSLFTSLSEVIGGVLDRSSDRRNNFLGAILDSNWEKAVRQINEAGISTSDFEKSIRKVIEGSSKVQKELSDQGKTLDGLIEEYGSMRKLFESGALSSDILVDALDELDTGFEKLELSIDRLLKKGSKGNDVSQMQKALKELGYDLGSFGANLDGVDGIFGAVTQAAVRAFQETNGLTVDGIVGPETLAALEKATAELNEANKESKGVAQNLKDLVKNVDELGGRQKLINAFSKLWKEFSKIVEAVQKGWNNIFGDVDMVGAVSEIIDKFANWVDSMEVAEGVLGNIESIIAGIAAAIQTGMILGGGVFGVLNKIVQTAIRFVGLDLISVLGDIGDALVKFRKYLVSDNELANFFELIGTKLAAGFEFIYATIGSWADEIRNWFAKFKEFEGVTEIFDKFISYFKNFGGEIVEWLGGVESIFRKFFDTIEAFETITFDGVLNAIGALFKDLAGHVGVLGGILKPVIGLVSELLERFLAYTGTTSIFKGIVEWIQNAYQAYKDWCNGLEESKDLPKKVGEAIANGLIKVLEGVGKLLAGIIKGIVSIITGIPMEAADEFAASGISMGMDIVKGIAVGLVNGIKFVVEAILSVASTLIKTFADKLRIESPSKVFIAFGGFIIAGLITGILHNLPAIKDVLASVGTYISDNFGDVVSSIKEFFKKLDFSKMSAIFWTVSSFIPSANILNIIAAVSGLIASVGSTISDGFNAVVDGTKTAATALGNGLVAAFEIIKKAIGGTVTFLRDNFGAIAAILGGYMIVQIITPLAKIVLSITTVASKISDAVSGLLKTIGKAAELVGKGIFILLLAHAIKILASAFVELANLSWGDLAKGAAVIGGLAVVLGVLLIALTKFSKKMTFFDTQAMFSMAAVMLSLAASLGVLAYSLILMDQVDDSRLIKHIGAITALAVGLGVVAAVMSKIKGTISKGSIAMIAISAAILILVLALTKLNALTINEPGKTIAALLALAAGLSVVALMSKGINKGAALGMLGMVLSIMLFVKVLEKLAKSQDILSNGLGTITVILGLFAGLMAATRLIGKDAGKDMFKVCSGILMLSLALVVVVAAMKALAKMDTDGLKQSLVAVSVLMLIFAAIIAVSKFSGEHAMRAGVMLIMMSSAMLILSAAVWTLALIGRDNADGLRQALGVVTVLMSMFALLIFVSQYAQKSMGAIIAITAAIGVLVAAIGILSILAKDPETLWTAVGALSAIMTVLGLLVAALKFVPSGKSAIGSIGTLVAVSGIVYLLTYLIKDLAGMPNMDKAISAAGALSVLLVAISAACFLLGRAGAIDATAIIGASAMGVVLVEIVYLLKILDRLNVAPSIETAVALSTLLLAMSAATLVLSKIGLAAKAAVSGATAMMMVVGVIGICAAGLGAVMSLCDAADIEAWKTGLESLMDLIVTFAGGIGEAIGAFAGGLFGGVLAGVGMGLSDFMTNIQGFLDGARSIDGSVVEGVKNLTIAILALTGAAVLEKLTSVFNFGSMDQLGVKLGQFGLCLTAFLNSVKDLTPADIVKIQLAAVAGQALADLANSIPKTGGLWQKIAGESDMADFGLRMEAFGNSLIRYSKSVKDLTAEDAENITRSATAGEAMATLAGKVPKSNGWWQTIAGASDISDFGIRMEAFGHSLLRYAASVKGLTAEDATAITNSATIGEAMSAMESSVPKSEGWWQDIAGESNMETFGLRMVAFGHSLCDYANAVKTLPDGSDEIIAKSQTAAEALVAVAKVIPKDEGWWGKIAGEQNFEAFGKGMYEIARGLSRYASVASDIDDTDVENIKNSKDAIKALADVSKALPNEGGIGGFFAGDENISAFGTGISALAQGVKDYLAIVDTIDWESATESINSSKTAIVAMTDAAKSIPHDGGVADFFTGKLNIAGFGHNMCVLAEYVTQYAMKVGALGKPIVLEGIENSKVAITAMAEAAKAIPHDGGVADFFTGRLDLAGFGTAMCSLADSVAQYATKVGALSKPAMLDGITNSKTAIAAMAEAARSIVLSEFNLDKTDFATFGVTMCSIAQSTVDYANISDAFNKPAMAEGITNSVPAISALVDAAYEAAMLGTVKLTDVSGTVNELSKIVAVITDMSNLKLNGTDNLTKILKELGETNVDGFVAAFTGSSEKVKKAGAQMMMDVLDGVNSKQDILINAPEAILKGMISTIAKSMPSFKTSGSTIIENVVTGIASQTKAVNMAATVIVKGALSAMRGAYSSWQKAGQYLVQGFANGIGSYSYVVDNAARVMARSALNAAKKELIVKSPSRAFYEIGTYAGAGFANALVDYATEAYNASAEMASEARQGLSDAVSKIANVIESDLDAQPTIRPVMDLSDIKSGINTIGGLMDMGMTVGATANVGAISTMMNRRNQNGANADVVSELVNLGRKLDNVGGDSYSIGSVNYQEGSDVAEALKTIIRAATMERRS